MHALGRALDYLRQNPATSSFVVGMRQGQTNNFLFPSSEREGDGEINLGEIPSKKEDMNKILPQTSWWK